MYFVVLKFIRHFSECRITLGGGGDEALGVWQKMVEENLAHTEELIRVRNLLRLHRLSVI